MEKKLSFSILTILFHHTLCIMLRPKETSSMSKMNSCNMDMTGRIQAFLSHKGTWWGAPWNCLTLREETRTFFTEIRVSYFCQISQNVKYMRQFIAAKMWHTQSTLFLWIFLKFEMRKVWKYMTKLIFIWKTKIRLSNLKQRFSMFQLKWRVMLLICNFILTLVIRFVELFLSSESL